MRSLYDSVRSKLPADTPIPSQRWMEFQLWPKNPLLKSAVQYTGRYAITHMVQSRQLRKDHVDVMVGHVEFKYLKSFAVMMRRRPQLPPSSSCTGPPSPTLALLA